MIKVEINTDDLQQVIRTMPSQTKLVMEDALAYAGNKFMKTWHQQRFQGGEGIREHDKRHGLFSRFKKTVLKESGNMGLKIAASNKVAYLLETGYTQTSGGGLNRVPVPLTKSKTVYRKGPDGPFNHRSWNDLLRQINTKYDSLRYAPIPFKGQWYITKIKFRKRTKDVLEPLFVLKNKVTVKPRLGFYSTFESMRPTLWNMLATRLIRGVKREWSKGEVSFSV